MTIKPDSKLARAYRIARKSPRMAYQAQGYHPPRHQYTPETEGIGHAAAALIQARKLAESDSPIYGGMPGKSYPDTDAAFRGTIKAHDVTSARIDHSGWYTDPFCEAFRDGTGLCWGVVCQLPGKRGRVRYVAGYQHGVCDGGPDLDLTTVYESENPGWYGETPQALVDAARAANDLARIAAESERECQTARQAGSQWADLRETVTETRREILALLKERRAALASGISDAGYFKICDTIRFAVSDMLETIRESRETMANLAAGDDSDLYFYPCDRLKWAFCEGAGISESEYPA